jgi:hypothetical protein
LIPLPDARRIWNCKEVNPKNVYQECGDEIYQDPKTKLVLNFRDCKGGLKGERHECPYRVGGKHHHFEPLSAIKIEQQHREKFCIICMDTYDSIRMPLCPHCFRLECRKCKNLQSWIAGNGMICFVCGGQCDIRQIWNRYQMLYGKYEY